jgi:hypothetical protein
MTPRILHTAHERREWNSRTVSFRDDGSIVVETHSQMQGDIDGARWLYPDSGLERTKHPEQDWETALLKWADANAHRDPECYPGARCLRRGGPVL